MEYRRCKLIAFIGVNGTGKTTAIINLLTSTGKRSLILTPHFNEYEKYPENLLEKPTDFQFEGIHKNYFPSSELLKSVVRYFYDGTLVLEESRMYLESRPSPLNYALLNGLRQRMTDIIFVGHAFSDIPPIFLNRMTRVVLFQTLENIDRCKAKLTYYEILKEAQTRVNQHALTNPHYCEFIKLSGS